MSLSRQIKNQLHHPVSERDYKNNHKKLPWPYIIFSSTSIYLSNIVCIFIVISIWWCSVPLHLLTSDMMVVLDNFWLVSCGCFILQLHALVKIGKFLFKALKFSEFIEFFYHIPVSGYAVHLSWFCLIFVFLEPRAIAPKPADGDATPQKEEKKKKTGKKTGKKSSKKNAEENCDPKGMHSCLL